MPQQQKPTDGWVDVTSPGNSSSGGDWVDAAPVAPSSDVGTGLVDTPLALAGAGVKKVADAAIHHPVGTMETLAAGKYLSPTVIKVLKSLPGAQTAQYIPQAVKDVAGYLVNDAKAGAGYLGGLLGRGASALSEGAESVAPLLMTQSQAQSLARQTAINSALNKTQM